MRANANMRKQLDEHPYQTILIILLYAAGVATFPSAKIANFFGGGEISAMLIDLIARFLCCVIPLILVCDFGYYDVLTFKNFKWKSMLYFLPCLIVSINNFPIVSLIEGEASFAAVQGAKTAAYVFLCISIGAVEEIIFRGCIYKIIREKTQGDKHGFFFSLVFSSAIFGCMHLINLLNGFSPAVFLQMGYSFLIGAMCGFALEKTGNIYMPILLHSLFDLGGLLSDYSMVSGNIWTVNEMIATAVVGVIVAVFIVYVVCKTDKDETNLTNKPLN